MFTQKLNLFKWSKSLVPVRRMQGFFDNLVKGVPASLQPTDGRMAANLQDGSRTLAGMLLAAVVAALMAVADQLIETWADGHLLAVWVALWTIAFAALALLAPPLRQLSFATAAMWHHWLRQRAARRSDQQILSVAQQDHRVLREIQMAYLRSENES
jgi:hypothetical protein